ncbi:MAG: 1-acyl-sn-glycerol-3-phosphate acyltransferase [Gemmatimonadota bacterium]|nr:1-acyl-sn-glycerol-3-phosphate acyltransferase [Gemmatimonadota bacterium]
MSVLRTAFTMIVLVALTLVFATILLLASVIGLPNRDGSVYDVLPRVWARAILWAAGVKVRIHGLTRIGAGGTFIFICNHVSLFDILALVGWLPRNNFIAKAELFRIPIFGPGIRVLGTVPIERANQKSAFSSYDTAAARIRGGSSVVVFPEGTRGRSYAIRPFKKGPFVLAIKAGAPIVPVVVHGTIEILAKGAVLIHPGVIDVHILESVATAGLTYDDRDVLAQLVQDRMQQAMTDLTSTVK